LYDSRKNPITCFFQMVKMVELVGIGLLARSENRQVIESA
jgi:hypothetical protein